LKFFALPAITEHEYQAIKLNDHTQKQLKKKDLMLSTWIALLIRSL